MAHSPTGDSATRERILAVTRDLLRTQPTISIGRIAAAAHISRATLYRYFPDKATLLRSAGVDAGLFSSRATTRERILEAAIEVVGERGMHAATMDEIAGRAGLSRSGLQWHYRTKDELIEDLVRHIPLLALVTGEVVQAGSPDADLEDQLIRLADHLLLHATTLRAVGRVLLLESAIYPEVARLVSTHTLGRVLPLLARLFEQHTQNGKLRPGSAQVRAQALVGMFMVLVLLRPALAHLLAPDDEATMHEYIEILLHGIAAMPQDE